MVTAIEVIWPNPGSYGLPRRSQRVRIGTAASSASVRYLRLETGRRSLQGLGNTIPKVLPGSLTHAVFEDIQ